MKNSIKRKTLLACVASLSVAAISLTAGITLAAYNRKTRIEQNVSVADRKADLVYLDATEWDIDGAIFYMYVWNTSGGVNSKFLKSVGKTTEGYYVYSFQSTVHNKLLFVRSNPNAPSNLFNDNGNPYVTFTNPASGNTEGAVWNKTGDLSYSSSTPLCKIISSWSADEFKTSDNLTVLGTISTSSWSAYTY